MKNKDSLELFMESYPLTKVMRYDDMLVYSIKENAALESKKSNNLIKELGLPLMAEVGMFGKTLIVRKV